MHPDRRQILHFACLVLKCNWQWVQSSLLCFSFAFNKMVIKPLFYLSCLSLILAGQLSIAGGYLRSLNTLSKAAEGGGGGL